MADKLRDIVRLTMRSLPGFTRLRFLENSSPGLSKLKPGEWADFQRRALFYGLINLKKEVLPEIGQSTEFRPSVSG